MHILAADKEKPEYTEGYSDIQHRVKFCLFPEYGRKVRVPLTL